MSMAHGKRPPPDPPKFNVERPRVKSFRNSLNCFPSGKTPGARLLQHCALGAGGVRGGGRQTGSKVFSKMLSKLFPSPIESLARVALMSNCAPSSLSLAFAPHKGTAQRKNEQLLLGNDRTSRASSTLGFGGFGRGGGGGGRWVKQTSTARATTSQGRAITPRRTSWGQGGGTVGPPRFPGPAGSPRPTW